MRVNGIAYSQESCKELYKKMNQRENNKMKKKKKKTKMNGDEDDGDKS